MAPPVIMHVNYCEQGQTLEDMCQKAVKWGFDGIEFRRRRSGVDETPVQYLDELARAVEKSGLKHVLFGGPGPNLMSSDADVRAKEVEEAEAFYREAAKRFELTVCNTMTGSLRNPDPSVPGTAYHLHGSYAAQDAHWEQAAEGFKHLGEVAKELGFKFAFETHMNYLHDSPEATHRLLGLIEHPNVGTNLDYGNIHYFPKPPSLAATVELLADTVYLVHLKNSIKLPDGQAVKLGLGDGDINNREFMRLLKDRGYTGPICIEAPRAGDREWFAQQDLAYIKSVLDDLGW